MGAGYTGSRVAQILRNRGLPVITTDSRSLDVSKPFNLDFIHSGASVLISIPTLADGDPTAQIVESLRERRPARVVYLSTTGVYGAQTVVDALSQPAPRNDREQMRRAAELAVMGGPWSSLVLRPAAIYGPGRGVHCSMAAGTWTMAGDGSNYVSRIHVDDLAAITAAALLRSEVTGAYPVADDEPSTSYEITRFCADLLDVPMPPKVDRDNLPPTRQSDRQVDGREIRRLLSVPLQYGSYRTGIPASLAY